MFTLRTVQTYNDYFSPNSKTLLFIDKALASTTALGSLPPTILQSRRYIKEKLKQTITTPNHNLFIIWEYTLVGWCSCRCLHPMRWQISYYLDQWDDRGCSKALHSSQLIYFAISSYIYIYPCLHMLSWKTSVLSSFSYPLPSPPVTIRSY